MERMPRPESKPEVQENGNAAGVKGRQENGVYPEEVKIFLGSPVDGAQHEEPKAAQVLEPIDHSQRFYVELEAVSAFVPRSFAPPSAFSKLIGMVQGRSKTAAVDEKKYRQVLFNVHGSVKSGEVLALMGPSGSGKTTLLSIMGARAQKMLQVRGQVTFNGRPLSKRLKRRVGYVMQDDLLYEALTVYETLYYAAMLRLPRYMTTSEKVARVETVIRALGLDTCRDTIIGGFSRKGISGGERKRTSVGHELLINPSLLFLDEPTSGLDSTTAMHLLGILRDLAGGGRALVTTIHQPSSRLYQQLDKLLLLSQGHVMYYGSASLAPDFFDTLGYRMPYGVNAADFILDLASGDVGVEGRDGAESRIFLIERSEAFLENHRLEGFTSSSADDLQVDMSDGASKGVPSSAPATPRDGDSANANVSAKHTGRFETDTGAGEAGHLAEDHRWGAPYFVQTSILLKRAIRTRRFESFSWQQIFQQLTIAVLAGVFWLQKANEDTVVAARNTLGLLFFSLMFLSMRVMFTSLFTFPSEHKMMLKERASGMYRLSAFYFARLMSDLPMDFTLPTLFMLIVYFMGALRYNVGAFFAFYGANLLAMLVGQSLGLWIGSIVMNPKSAQALASVVMMIMVLTGGFFVLGLPDWISWLKYGSYIYYALGILLYIEFDGGKRTIYSCVQLEDNDQCTPMNPSNPETAPGCSPVTDLQNALGLSQNPASQADAIRNAGILVAFLLVFRLCIYWTLRKKTRS